MHRLDPLFYEPITDKKSGKVDYYDNRRVKLRDLGGYCHAVQGAHVPVEELDQEVEVGNPFIRFYRHRPDNIDGDTLDMTPEEFDELLTHIACSTLRDKIEARPSMAAWVVDKEAEDARDRLYEAWKARAGAALWLFERDKRRNLVNCGEYTFSLMCGGTNFELDGSETYRGHDVLGVRLRITGYDVHTRLDASLDSHVHLRARVHILRDGVYIENMCMYTTINAGQETKIKSDVPRLSDECPSLLGEIIKVTKQVSIENQRKSAEYEQAKLDGLKKLLGSSETKVG